MVRRFIGVKSFLNFLMEVKDIYKIICRVTNLRTSRRTPYADLHSDETSL